RSIAMSRDVKLKRPLKSIVLRTYPTTASRACVTLATAHFSGHRDHHEPGPAAWERLRGLEAHAAHSAGHRRHRRLILGYLGDGGFGSDQQSGDRRGILQSRANDLGWIDHAGLDQVLVGFGLRVESEILIVAI